MTRFLAMLPIIKALDADGDGELTKQEFVKMVPDWAPIEDNPIQLFFRFIDSDRSGTVSESEFTTVRSRFRR